MDTLWLSYVVALLCHNTQLRTVLAGKEKLGRNKLVDWIDTKGSVGTGDRWDESTQKDRIYADISPSRGIAGENWFITSILDLPDTSYLEIEARFSKCDRTTCQLHIYGTNSRSVSDEHKFFKDNFIFINSMTFDLNKQSLKSVTINESYTRLAILIRAKTSTTSSSIYAIGVSYYFCKNTTIDMIELGQVNSSTQNITEKVNCQSNAVAISDGKSTEINATCTPKGNWIFEANQTCACNEGFGLDSSSKCSACKKGFYKAEVSNIKCRKCPDGKTNDTMNTKCQCLQDRYLSEDENGPCYAVPSKVEGIKIYNYGKFVHVSWSKPSYVGDPAQSLTYSIECYHCNQSKWDKEVNNTVFSAREINLTKTLANVSCNESKCDKKVENAVFFPGETNLTAKYVNVSNLTMNETYKVKIVSIIRLINVSSEKWKYAEKCFIFKISDSTTKRSTSATANPSTNATRGTNAGESDNNIFIYIAIGAGAAFLVLVLLIIFIITKLRRTKAYKGADNPGFDMTVPSIGQRTYIDPSNYQDLEVAVREFANEISPSVLNLERVLGGGEFGDVYKGTLKTETGGVLEIAAKTLKYDSDERSRKDFFMEASAMGQFKDLNVIHLEGVITKSVPHMIVTEYMSNGSLDNFLKQNDEKLTDLQLVGMARGVASGMRYLADMNFVHRDLAARNILVNETLLCKVADFGLSRELETADSSRGEYCTSGGKIPVRWTAPEAIKYRKFSTASDVWSYGILLWEIMAFAERPYWDWDNFKVLERIDDGYRLPAPKNCPKAVHELMLGCWDTDRSQRPQFNDIVKMLDEWIRSPETIRYEKKSRPASGGVSDTSILVKEWLNDIKMSSYIPNFTQAGFTQLSDLAGLLDSDLEAIGISLVGHRNKMLRTIRTLPITDQSKQSAWNRAASLKV